MYYYYYYYYFFLFVYIFIFGVKIDKTVIVIKNDAVSATSSGFAKLLVILSCKS